MLDAQFRQRLPHNATEGETRLRDPRTAAIECLEPATSVHVGGSSPNRRPFDRTAERDRPWFPRSGAHTVQVREWQHCMRVAG